VPERVAAELRRGHASLLEHLLELLGHQLPHPRRPIHRCPAASAERRVLRGLTQLPERLHVQLVAPREYLRTPLVTLPVSLGAHMEHHLGAGGGGGGGRLTCSSVSSRTESACVLSEISWSGMGFERSHL
jgi:hypothetical protein